MTDSGLTELIVRVAVSLTVVMAIIGVGYVAARRRARGGASSARPGRSRFAGRSATLPIEVVGRVGLSRGSMAIALRFGDSVLLVGVSEQAPTTVLQQVDAAHWDELRAAAEPRVRARGAASESNGPLGPQSTVDSIVGRRPTFIEALREATSRRG
ncbi:MAG: hypothetical protein ACI8RE_000594 [Ilumatobacter sp.]|jgi:hypothetical protein